MGHIFKPNKSFQYIKPAFFRYAGGVSLSVCAHFLPKGLFREGNVAERYLARAAALLNVDKSIHP